MSFLNDSSLTALGWSTVLQFHYDELNDPHLVPARVISEEKSLWEIQGPEGLHKRAKLSGKLRLQIEQGEEKPCVGDWVVCEVPKGDFDSVLIRGLLPRRTCLARALGGHKQVIIANVDTVLMAASANENFNLRRIERYLSAVLDSGARPVIVLTKTDLSQNQELIVLQKHFPTVDIIAVTNTQPESFQPLSVYLKEGQTLAIVGSSGVGKSTLINGLLGEPRQATLPIRESDGKGRHSTTRRQFFKTPFGGWIVDTPGMREFGLLDQQDGLESYFAKIVELEKHCRFKDCHHDQTPGCAIEKALKDGELDLAKWQSFLKMRQEMQFQERKNNKKLQSEQKDKWKKIHKAQKVLNKMRKGQEE